MLSVRPPNELQLILRLPLVHFIEIHPRHKHSLVSHISVYFSVCIRVSEFVKLKAYFYTLSNFIAELSA